MIISELVTQATEKLKNVSDSPRLDVEVLLCHVLQKERSYLMTWPDKEISDHELTSFNQLLSLRIEGNPIAHITGQREFWSLPLEVSKDTLIPRPETELLVEQILQRFPQNRDIQLADLGTGTGAIALAIAKEKPDWNIIATDQSALALKVATNNADKLSIKNVEFRCGEWCQALNETTLDIIVSNPPYIVDTDPHLKQGDVRFEPHAALASGADGLEDIRLITSCCLQHLKSGGMLLLEHGYDQKQSVNEIFLISGYKKIEQLDDLSGNPRITLGIKP